MSDVRPPRWGLYPWFEAHGTGWVHPDDIERFRRLMPFGRLFVIEGGDSGCVVVRAGCVVTRVRPELLVSVPAPAFGYGEWVRVVGKDFAGEVVEIWWHHQENRPFFHLDVGGKRCKTRFWEANLERATRPETPEIR